jgi:hypothetical protein
VVELGDKFGFDVAEERGEVDVLDAAHQRLADLPQPVPGLFKELAPGGALGGLAVLQAVAGPCPALASVFCASSARDAAASAL